MKNSVFCILFGLLSTTAFAQTSTTTLSLPSTTVDAASTTQTSESNPTQTSTIKKEHVFNKKFEEDQNITDAKLKADAGSLERYSIKFNLSYAGPPVGDLDNKMQPNPDGSAGTYETSLGGSISARYRISTSTALSLGTGVSALTPVQGVKRYDVKNPFVSYDMSNRFWDTQMRNAFGATLVTNPDWKVQGETSGLTYDNYWLYNIGTSGWGIELDTSFAYWIYDRGANPKNVKEMKSGMYTVNLYPQVKYNFSDKFSANTSLNMPFVSPRGSNDRTILWNRTLSQRVGVGYAFTRDIYFSPYLNFYPKSAELDSTTINFSTTFSIL
ncbi:MAG TPA: hypothetical protein VN132_03800 [Bdellovibrio sp.]|nr:hypothetical protein [Bdellovibrio sp.]